MEPNPGPPGQPKTVNGNPFGRRLKAGYPTILEKAELGPGNHAVTLSNMVFPEHTTKKFPRLVKNGEGAFLQETSRDARRHRQEARCDVPVGVKFDLAVPHAGKILYLRICAEPAPPEQAFAGESQNRAGREYHGLKFGRGHEKTCTDPAAVGVIDRSRLVHAMGSQRHDSIIPDAFRCLTRCLPYAMVSPFLYLERG